MADGKQEKTTERGIPDFDEKTGEAADWFPITDPLHIGMLGKLAEETGELSAAIARCLIQGMNGAEPTTFKINRQWLQEEISDVIAMMAFVRNEFNLDEVEISKRVHRKIEFKTPWFGYLARLRTWEHTTP